LQLLQAMIGIISNKYKKQQFIHNVIGEIGDGSKTAKIIKRYSCGLPHKPPHSLTSWECCYTPGTNNSEKLC